MIMDEEKRGEMIVFASAKGGVGKTITCVNLAVALAQKGHSVCILDGNFQFGDINLALDLQPKLTISELAQEIETLNDSILLNYIQNHESGVKVLSAPLKPEYADLITCTIIETIVGKISNKYEYLIIDLSSGLSEFNIRFMELAQKILIVTDLEMAALKNTKTMIKTLGIINLSEKINVVVNRCDMESVIKAKDVPGILEVEEMYCIPNDFKVVSKSFNIGIPFILSKPKEKISLEVSNLAAKISNRKLLSRGKRRRKRSILDIFKK